MNTEQPVASRTPRRRWRMWAAALAPVIGYVLMQAYPQLLFAHGVSMDGIELHSTRRLPVEAVGVIHQAAALVARSELAQADRTERVFVTDQPWLARLFSPGGSGFAFHVATTGNIFVSDGNLGTDTAHSDDAPYDHRRLSAVIAHEITHGLLDARFGLLASAKIPLWVSEGYCDYIAQESSFPDARGWALLKNGATDGSRSFDYFRYRQEVAYLIDQRHLSLPQIVQQSESSTALLQGAQRALRDP